MTRVILIAAVLILAFFVFKLVRLLKQFEPGSRPNIDDLKDRAANLKNKLKDIPEADFREIPPDEDDLQSFEEGNGKK